MPVARVSPASYTGHLPHSSVSVRQARAQLASALYERDVLGSLVDDAVLILSEFVTNSLRHARALNSGTIRVSWELSGDGLLRIEVTDGGGTTRPSTKPYSMSVSAQAGRGLEIVDRLADRWGSQREEGGDEYTVWAELGLRARHTGRRLRTERGAVVTGTVTALPSAPSVSTDGVTTDPPAAPTASAPQRPVHAEPRAAVLHLLPTYPPR
ncbi:ATP-binding protein [Actinocrinis puniceicyclus]|uniref:ATP-binding protein n=1 Tax=Actinocrinis puniceicyclus TaxID=977794 RepID=A0A8J7WQX7_9ACTN|nr:ATP-binding protein [Actinocrinis puniceicyclus]MBS2964797.1 ATP-binding protein [Actinocrinis puniceicyclus]